MNDQVLVEPEPVTGARFDGQSDPRVPTHIADLAVLGQVPGHDFVTVETNPNDRDLRTPVGFDGDQVGQPRTVEHNADGIGNLHGPRTYQRCEGQAQHASAIAWLGRATQRRRHACWGRPAVAPRVREAHVCKGTNAPGGNAQPTDRSRALA